MAIRTFTAIAGASLAALTMTLVASPSLAQDATAEPQAAPEGEEQAIVVTGFRASLATAVNTKKTSSVIVESVSAEDIGRLPDASIGESIARLPGLTTQRLFGRANSIAIRGSSADLSSTTLNGRPQTSTGEQRNVEFDQFPSEIVSRVDVYKAPQANLVHQGLVGTVDIKTIRPLEFGKGLVSFGGRGTYTDLGKVNADSNEFGYRATGTYVGQFMEDRLGVALSAAYTDEPYQAQEFEAWGYADAPNGTKVIGGMKPFGVSTQLQRLGIQGTVQFKPVDELMLTVDGFYGKFTDKQIKRGVEFPLAFSPAQLSTAGIQTNGNLITQGTFTGVEAVVNNHGYERRSDIFSGGFNADWTGDDGWSASFDFGYSKTDRSELTLETNAGTGPGAGVGAADTLTFVSGPTGTTFTSNTLDYGNYNTIVLTDPLGWGAGAPLGSQEGYYNDRIIDDEIKSFQIEVGKELESGFLSKLTVGTAYVDRTKGKTPVESFLNLAGGAKSLTVPEKYRTGATDLGFIGVGPIIGYDPFAMLEDGVYVLTPNTSKDVPAKAYSVTERVMSIYIKGDLKAAFGAVEMDGNIGLLAQNTEQKSRGFQNLASASLVPVTRGARYWDFLPSMNLNFRLPADWVVRVAAAREIQRPRFEDMKVSLDYSYNVNSGVITGNGGNPQLEPYRAWAADLNIEKYFGSKGYVGVQMFYKKLDNYIYRDVVPFDYSGLPVVAPVPITNFVGTITTAVNGTGGELYGVELAGTLPFDVITPALEGFGFTGGLGYTKTSIKPGPNADSMDLPDYSRWVGSGTLFFEKAGFNARVSARYRSSFQGIFVGFGGERELRRALKETIVDAQIGYDFQESSPLNGLSLFLQGQNLTDEPFVSVDNGAPLQIRNYQTYGRRFMAGFNYKF
ncbi:MAG: TonB-dependent receptor [Novosphingobium sp. 17-62-19]|uniref:TonB-dependent receptor n=1 Tax=Novosphingobium sp. 17-62-19 TaxID=1970406 RepID=UPI000BD6602C|nr:TonB-dependent receptor [Novosphingobium sp. 17-62-19]OZA20909.1 MAG: TonB-dependent receptor [Novosphingobium sp. 17-62-19]HQS97350.1 TonB-dependent receptor [Novosphingobium sp.]